MGKVNLHYHHHDIDGYSYRRDLGEAVISINPSDTVFLKPSEDRLRISVNGQSDLIGEVHENTPALQKIALLEEMSKILDAIDAAGTSEKTIDIYVRQDNVKGFGKSASMLKQEEQTRFENAIVNAASNTVTAGNFRRFIEQSTLNYAAAVQSVVKTCFENGKDDYAEKIMGIRAPKKGYSSEDKRKSFIDKVLRAIGNELSDNPALLERVSEVIKEGIAREKESYEQAQAQKLASALEDTSTRLFDIAKKADEPIAFSEGTRFYISASTNGIRQKDMELLEKRFVEHEISKLESEDALLDYCHILKLPNSLKMPNALTQATLVWAVNETEQRAALLSLSTASTNSFGATAPFVEALGGNAENGYTVPIDMKSFAAYGDDFIEITRDELNGLMEKRAEYAATLIKGCLEIQSNPEVPTDLIDGVKPYVNFGFIKPEEITQMVQEICTAKSLPIGVWESETSKQCERNGEEMCEKILSIVASHPTVREVQREAAKEKSTKKQENINLD